MLDGIKVNGRLLNWDLHDWVCIIGVVMVLVAIAHATTLTVLCPEHGVNAAYTGNRKKVEKKWYCEYSHPNVKNTHKFWSECE